MDRPNGPSNMVKELRINKQKKYVYGNSTTCCSHIYNLYVLACFHAFTPSSYTVIILARKILTSSFSLQRMVYPGMCPPDVKLYI
jgi:hypothetical protein